MQDKVLARSRHGGWVGRGPNNIQMGPGAWAGGRLCRADPFRLLFLIHITTSSSLSFSLCLSQPAHSLALAGLAALCPCNLLPSVPGFSFAFPNKPRGGTLQSFAPPAMLCYERDHKPSPRPPSEQVPVISGITSGVAQGQRKPDGWPGSAGVSSCWSRPLTAVRLGIR